MTILRSKTCLGFISTFALGASLLACSPEHGQGHGQGDGDGDGPPVDMTTPKIRP